MNLAGKVSNQLGEAQSGLTVELYEAATWEAGGAATASTTTNANGNWAFTAIDPTKTWTVVAISGSKRIVIDAQASIQVTQLEVITDISVDTINERTAAAGVTIDGALLKDGFVVDAAIPAAIARDAEVDSKITTHKGDAAAHHTKTAHNEVYGLVQDDLAANRPVAGVDGRWFFASDTLILSRDNGTAWVEMARGETAIRLAQLSEKVHTSLTGVTSDQHHPQLHKATHGSGGADAFVKNDVLLAAARYLDDVTDPPSDAQNIWLVDGGSEIRYWDDLPTPVKRTLVDLALAQTLLNKTLTSPIITDVIRGALSGADGFVLRDIKNLPDGVLSGTPKLVEVNIDGATYYLKIYPVLT